MKKMLSVIFVFILCLSSVYALSTLNLGSTGGGTCSNCTPTVPGADLNEIQFNNNSQFDGVPGFTYDPITFTKPLLRFSATDAELRVDSNVSSNYVRIVRRSTTYPYYHIFINNNPGAGNFATYVGGNPAASPDGEVNAQTALYSTQPTNRRVWINAANASGDERYGAYFRFSSDLTKDTYIFDKNYDSRFGGNVTVVGNLTAPNICYSNGTNCVATGSTFNNTNILYSNQTWTQTKNATFANKTIFLDNVTISGSVQINGDTNDGEKARLYIRGNGLTSVPSYTDYTVGDSSGFTSYTEYQDTTYYTRYGNYGTYQLDFYVYAYYDSPCGRVFSTAPITQTVYDSGSYDYNYWNIYWNNDAIASDSNAASGYVVKIYDYLDSNDHYLDVGYADTTDYIAGNSWSTTPIDTSTTSCQYQSGSTDTYTPTFRASDQNSGDQNAETFYYTPTVGQIHDFGRLTLNVTSTGGNVNAFNIECQDQGAGCDVAQTVEVRDMSGTREALMIYGARTSTGNAFIQHDTGQSVDIEVSGGSLGTLVAGQGCFGAECGTANSAAEFINKGGDNMKVWDSSKFKRCSWTLLGGRGYIVCYDDNGNAYNFPFDFDSQYLTFNAFRNPTGGICFGGYNNTCAGNVDTDAFYDKTYFFKDVYQQNIGINKANVSYINVTTINNTYLQVNGNFTLTGKGTVWNDVVAPLTAAKVGLNAPSFDESNMTYYFADVVAANQEQYTFAEIQTPHWMRTTTTPNTVNIGCHIHGYADTTAKDNVTFKLDYMWTNIGNTQGGITSINKTQQLSGVAMNHTVIAFPSIDAVNKTISSSLKMKLTRTSATAPDNSTANFYVDFLDCHFEQSLLGSDTEYY